MAVPKKAKSKAKKNSRRAHHAISAKAFISCPNCGEAKLLHRVCQSCGFFRGKEVIAMDED